jgi:predicted DNA-binding protein
MLLDAIKPLVDSGIINEDTQQAITEAWEAKLLEARESVRAELREEFATRYQHDKQVMVEALDKMVTESLHSELQEFAVEKQKLAEDRVKFKSHMMESSTKFNDFMVGKLAEEIRELREDRKQYENSVSKLESFVIKSLAEEIQEFEQDKQAVVETKVRLIAGAKDKLAELQQNFIARSAELVKESITSKLESEMTQLKEDIQMARENMFGRQLFEAFASEFAVTHLNENKEIRKLQAVIAAKEQALAEAREHADHATMIVESKEREIKVIKESTERKEILANLLNPLNKEKATVMSELLESVQTAKLQSAYDKYLPAVLNNTAHKPTQKKTVLSESRVEVTGDKSANTTAMEDNGNNVFEIKRLAGLK